MAPTYRIETDRLVLRRWKDEDFEPWIALATEPEFFHFPLRRAKTRDEAAEVLVRQRQNWLTRGSGLWAAELKESGELIGYIGLETPLWLPAVLPNVEIGWRIGKRFWGKGYAEEGARATLKQGFEEMLLSRVICIYEPENDRSVALAKRLGFVETRTMPDPTMEGITLVVSELTGSRFYAAR